MCHKRKKGGFLAWTAVFLGIFILAILILPRWVWWLLCGTALLAGGILLLRR